jgi:cytochrome c553
MKMVRLFVLTLVILSLVVSGVFAADVAKGKALFNDPKLGGGTAGKSCNSCHKDGSGIDISKKEFMGGKAKSVEEAVNMCITMMMKGKALDVKGADMANIVAYMKSLKGKASEGTPKKKKAIEGC